MKGGTIVDATIIDAPSSTKNEEKRRDPEMHPTKRRKQWRFGMKCQVGVDAGTGYVHTMEVTSANAHNAIDWTCQIEKRKFSVRSKVEHIFHIIKCQFGYRKVRYRGLKKNENRLYAMFA